VVGEAMTARLGLAEPQMDRRFMSNKRYTLGQNVHGFIGPADGDRLASIVISKVS
jgi:hypothetical protein